MNFLAMQQMVQDVLATPSTSQISLTLIKSMLNLSARHIYNKIVDVREQHFLTSGTITWVSGTELYSLPGATDRIVLVERTDTQTNLNINPIDITQKNLYQRNQNILYVPRYLWFWAANQIGFSPIPDQTFGTPNIKVWYVPTFTDMAGNTDVPPAEWTADYHEVIVWGAVKRLAKRLKEFGELYTDVYDELLDQLIRMVQSRQVQEAKTVEPPVDSDEC